MTQRFNWLQDQSRASEVLTWLEGRWEISQLEAWAKGRFGLDELKDWIDGKYSIDEVVNWKYHESDPVAKFVNAVVDGHRSGIESHGGKISLIGVDGTKVHVAFEGACGSCTARETGTIENLLSALRKGMPEFELINDGAIRQATGNYAVEAFKGAPETPVSLGSFGSQPSPSIEPRGLILPPGFNK